MSLFSYHISEHPQSMTAIRAEKYHTSDVQYRHLCCVSCWLLLLLAVSLNSCSYSLIIDVFSRQMSWNQEIFYQLKKKVLLTLPTPWKPCIVNSHLEKLKRI